MDLLKRIGRIVKDNLRELLDDTQDPEELLEAAITQMQQHLSSLRQSLAFAVATQKRTERTIVQHHAQASQWYRRAQQSLAAGEEIARSYLSRQQEYQKNAQDLLMQVESQQETIDKLKREMHFLEHRVVTAKIKKDLYITRLRSAIASQKLQQLTGEDCACLFDRVEEQILQLEAEAELISGVDSRWRKLDATANNLVENELLKLKQQQPPEIQNLGLQYTKGLPINKIKGDPEIDSLLSKIERI
jgi:phage shock protein A